MNRSRQRQPHTGNYKKVNAYSQKPAMEQIVAVVVFFIVLILHSVFIVPPIVAVIQNVILIFQLALHYVFILMIGYDYLFLTVKDPVDLLVQNKANQSLQKPEDLKKCLVCNKNVFSKSYHCMRCNRCTQNFDHHCKYLNNCVGGKNYESFFRILVTLTSYFINLIIQTIWVFVDSFHSQRLQDYMISKWPVLIVGIIILILLFGVDSLLIYHIYLTLIRHMTTLEYIFRETPSNSSLESRVTTSTLHQSENRLETKHNI